MLITNVDDLKPLDFAEAKHFLDLVYSSLATEVGEVCFGSKQANVDSPLIGNTKVPLQSGWMP